MNGCHGQGRRQNAEKKGLRHAWHGLHDPRCMLLAAFNVSAAAAPPVFDGLIAAAGRLLCLGGK